MMMLEIWKKRLKLHEKKMARYLKYVLNDHFVIVCFFIFGALSLGYSNLLKTLDSSFIWGRWIAVFIFVASIFIGKLATLIEAPDAVFLLPKEKELPRYLKAAKAYSLLLPTFLIVLLTAFVMPLLVTTTEFDFFDMTYFALILLLLKNWDLDIQLLSLKLSSKEERLKWQLIKLGIVIFSVALAVFFSPIIATFLAIVLQFVSGPIFKKIENETIYQWEMMVQDEEQRMHRIYQFINLFTDIPSLKGKVKRRRYLDILLQRIQPVHRNTFSFLYARTFLRGTEYSGLYLRLSVIVVLLIIFSHSFIMAILLSVLFIYLTGFQLVPLYFHYDNMALTRLYPVNDAAKGKALKKLFLVALGGQAIAIFITSLFTLTLLESLLLFISCLAFVFIFTQVYVPIRIKKMKKLRVY